jgi:hypothetical protein
LDSEEQRTGKYATSGTTSFREALDGGYRPQSTTSSAALVTPGSFLDVRRSTVPACRCWNVISGISQ